VITLRSSNPITAQSPVESSLAACLAVRDLGELNHIIAVVQKVDEDLSLVREAYRWACVKGNMNRVEDILSLAEMLGLIVLSDGSVRLTPFGYKFLALNTDGLFELTEEQRHELCRYVFYSPSYVAKEAEPVIASFRYNKLTKRYEYSIPDYGPPPGRREIYFLLSALRLMRSDPTGILSLDPEFIPEVASKIRRVRQLEEAERYPSEDLIEISKRAEHLAYDFEKKRLDSLGRPDLSARVELVADYDATVGYDVLSFNGEESRREIPDRFIEVKSTPTSDYHFYFSRYELQTARRLRKRYWIYLFRGVDPESDLDSCVLDTLQDPASRILDPAEFEISAKSLRVRRLPKGLGPGT